MKSDLIILHCARKVGDGDFMTTFSAPDVGEKNFPDSAGYGIPLLGGRRGEFGDGFDGHD